MLESSWLWIAFWCIHVNVRLCLLVLWDLELWTTWAMSSWTWEISLLITTCAAPLYIVLAFSTSTNWTMSVRTLPDFNACWNDIVSYLSFCRIHLSWSSIFVYLLEIDALIALGGGVWLSWTVVLMLMQVLCHTRGAQDLNFVLRWLTSDVFRG